MSDTSPETPAADAADAVPDAAADAAPEAASPSPDAPRRRRRRRLLIAAAVVVALAGGTAIGFAVHAATAGPQADAGAFLSDSTVDNASDQVAVKLPWGTLDVSAGHPLDRVPEDVYVSERYGEARWNEIEPPDDGSWVALKIEPDVTFDSVLFRSRPDATIPATTISVVSGDRSIPLARAAGGKQSSEAAISASLAPAFAGYLALPDRPSDLHLRVEFAGVRQEVYPYRGKVVAGPAASLYRGEAKHIDIQCTDGKAAGYRIGYVITDGCHLTGLLQLPYVAGLGWARPGRAWLVAVARTIPLHQYFRRAPSGRVATYYSKDDYSLERGLTGWTSRLRYGSLAPIATARFNDVNSGLFRDPDDPEQFIFDVASTDSGRQHDFTLTTRCPAETDEPVAGLPTHTIIESTRLLRVTR